MKNTHLYITETFLILLTIFLLAGHASPQKMTSDDIIAKHLQSRGRFDAGELKNVVASGVVQYTVLRKGGVGGNGRTVIASEGTKLLLGMSFPLSTYPAETIVYDGKDLKVAYAYNNVRSYLGDYIYRYNQVIKEGLMAGTLSMSWPLMSKESRGSKITFEGSKKIDGRQTLVLGFSPKNGSDLQIKMYFDAKIFEHVRTEYRRTISSQLPSAVGAPSLNRGAASADASSQQRELRQLLIEDFADYKIEHGLNLPHSYRLYVLLDGAEGTREYEWKSQFSEFFFNQPLDPGSFNTETK